MAPEGKDSSDVAMEEEDQDTNAKPLGYDPNQDPNEKRELRGKYRKLFREQTG